MLADNVDAPSIVGAPITSFRGGQTLRYAELTAIEKRDYLFDAGIRATAYAHDMPDVHLGIVQFAESAFLSFAHHLLGETITRDGDELESPKHKLFHSFGTTAKIRFTPVAGSPYTGLFQETLHGLLRFSYAGPVAGIGIVPGLGLKFFTDGDHPSQNAVMMRKLDPQSERSVFHSPFTNILPDPALTNLIMREVKKRFESVVADGRGLHQPVLNFARVHTNGDAVEGEVRAPYRVILVPTSDAKQNHNERLDFRDDLAQNLASGTTIYDVLAVDESADTAPLENLIPHAQSIGNLTTESEFIASSYGDYRLFFKHSDVYLRPTT
jgi:hypothetical protein